MTNRDPRSSERGTSVVEAALTLLMFFVVVLGICEGARFLNVQQTLTNAAREGARLGVVPLRGGGAGTLAGTNEIVNEVLRFLAAANVQGANVTVDRPNINGTNYTRVTVTAGYRVMTLSMFSPLEVTLSGKSLMRNETSP